MTPVTSARLQFYICCCFSIGERINAAIFSCVKKGLFTQFILEKRQGHSHHQGRALSLYRKNTVQYVCSKNSYFMLWIFWEDRQILWTNCSYCEDKLCSCRRYPYCWLHRFCSSPWKGVVGPPPAIILGWILLSVSLLCHDSCMDLSWQTWFLLCSVSSYKQGWLYKKGAKYVGVCSLCRCWGV